MEKGIVKSVEQKVNYWWLSLLVGVLAVFIGILSAWQPVLTVSMLTLFFIAGFLASGIFDVIFAISNRKGFSNWGWTLLTGIINLAFALILMAMPITNMGIFIYYVAFYVMLQSLMGIWGAISMKQFERRNWWMLLFVAILGLILSLIMILKFTLATAIITVVFSASLICYGLFRIFYSFRLRRLKKILEDD